MARRASKTSVTTGRAEVPAALPEDIGNKAKTAVEAQSRIHALEMERQKLAADLGEARLRIEDLERRQTEIADRIAWALDSLHDLISDKE